jgi:hypothetical protein
MVSAQHQPSCDPAAAAGVAVSRRAERVGTGNDGHVTALQHCPVWWSATWWSVRATRQIAVVQARARRSPARGVAHYGRVGDGISEITATSDVAQVGDEPLDSSPYRRAIELRSWRQHAVFGTTSEVG